MNRIFLLKPTDTGYVLADGKTSGQYGQEICRNIGCINILKNLCTNASHATMEEGGITDERRTSNIERPTLNIE
jgi:hypothetical protein